MGMSPSYWTTHGQAKGGTMAVMLWDSLLVFADIVLHQAGAGWQ